MPQEANNAPAPSDLPTIPSGLPTPPEVDPSGPPAPPASDPGVTDRNVDKPPETPDAAPEDDKSKAYLEKQMKLHQSRTDKFKSALGELDPDLLEVVMARVDGKAPETPTTPAAPDKPAKSSKFADDDDDDDAPLTKSDLKKLMSEGFSQFKESLTEEQQRREAEKQQRRYQEALSEEHTKASQATVEQAVEYGLTKEEFNRYDQLARNIIGGEKRIEAHYGAATQWAYTMNLLMQIHDLSKKVYGRTTTEVETETQRLREAQLSSQPPRQPSAQQAQKTKADKVRERYGALNLRSSRELLSSQRGK